MQNTTPAAAFSRVPLVCAIGTIAIGATALAGWILDVPVLRSLLPNYVEMKANAAIGLIAGGTSLLLLHNEHATPRQKSIGRWLAIFIVVLGGATLSEYLCAWDLGIDLLFFYEPPNAIATTNPGRMASQSAINFILKGLALLCVDWETKRGRRPSQWLSLFSSFFPLQALTGYAYGVKTTFGVGGFAMVTQMAVHTACAWILLSVGTLFARPHAGILKILSSDSYAGYISRRLLLPAMTIPLVLGWIVTVGEHTKLYDPGFGTSILVLTCVVIFVCLIWWSSLGLHKMESDRSASQAHLGLALDVARTGIWDHDLSNGVKMTWSTQCKTIFGIPENGIVTPDTWSKLVHPSDLRKVEESSETAFASGNDHIDQYRIVRPDGAVRWVETKARASRDEKTGKIIRVQGVTVDVTAKRDIERERTEILAREQAAVQTAKAKSEFLANMSHEIRTPINGVIGMTAMLADTALNFEQVDYVENIKRSSESLLTVINDILDFSKVEAGKLELEIIDFDIDQLIMDTVKAMSFSATKKGLELTVKKSEEVKYLYRGDPGRLKQILLNLLSNAIKFTKQGKVELRLTVSAVSESQSLFKLEVEDTGMGLSPASIGRMFQPFSQADSSTSRKFGGTGLGLSICKKLVELMNGKIGVISQEGHGSTFWLDVPLEKSTARRSSIANKAIFRAAESLSTIRILVAEDNTINQKVALGMLAKIGCKALAVANGKEVLIALESVKYDLVLMDCQMPEMDGYEATIAIRRSKNFSWHNIPIIAMTANAIQGDRDKCLAVGMNDYITKPIRIDLLAAVLEKWHAKDTGAATFVETFESQMGGQSVLDMSAIENLCSLEDGNKPKLLVELLNGFIHSIPPRIALMKQSVAHSDIKTLIFEAHSIKGAGASLGATRFAALCQKVEDINSPDRILEAQALVNQIDDECKTVIAEIRIILAETARLVA